MLLLQYLSYSLDDQVLTNWSGIAAQGLGFAHLMQPSTTKRQLESLVSNNGQSFSEKVAARRTVSPISSIMRLSRAHVDCLW
jgi:hypothetical protein